MIIHGDSKPNHAKQTTWEGIELALRNTICTAEMFDIATEFACECTACYCADCPLSDMCGESFTAEEWVSIREEVLRREYEKRGVED